MPRHPLCVSRGASFTLLAAVVPFFARLAQASPRAFCDRTALTVSGHFRRRPDRTAEYRLRLMFAELDKELAVVLGDRSLRLAGAG
ncbi:MAG TPA: hypothetical protein VGM12_13620 [Trebonia sp.]